MSVAVAEHRGGRVRLAATFLRVGVMNEMQYRINFFLQLVQSLLTVGTGLVILAVVFSKTDELGGWSRPQLLAVMGVFTLVGGIIRTFIQPNMQRVVEDVRQGKLDFALTKPADAQLLVSIREVRFWQLTDVLVGLAVLIVAVVQMRSTTQWQRPRRVRRAAAQWSGLDLLLLADAGLCVVLVGADQRGARTLRRRVQGRPIPGRDLSRGGCDTA